MKQQNHDALTIMESIMDNIFILESIVKLTKEACLEKEFNISYYNLNDKEKLGLSEERNHYINMLTLAIEQVNKIKESSLTIEDKMRQL